MIADPTRRAQEFLYYHEKLPEFEADEELSALMCVCVFHLCCVAMCMPARVHARVCVWMWFGCAVCSAANANA